MKKVLCLLLAVSLLGFIGAFDSARGELLLREGFDNFDSGVRPFGWTFNNCNANSDTYTTEGDYGVSSPSLKLDTTDDRATSRTFETCADSKLLFWIKGQGSIGTASLLVEEYDTSIWATVTNITTLPTTGTTKGPYNLPSDTTRVRFTFTKDTADGLALDDVRVQSGIYLRAWHMDWTSQGQTGYQGDATYYEFPGPDEVLGTLDDKNLLIDGGCQTTAGATVSLLLDDRLSGDPFNNTLYFMALSFPGADHYGGLKMAVDRYNVLNYYENVRWPAGDKLGYDSLIADIEAEGSNVYYYDAGDWLSGPDTTVGPSWGSWSGWDPNITARVLVANSNPPPGDDNEWAGVLLIKCGETGFLTGGDQTILQQETWIQDPENTDHSYDGAWNDLTHADFYKVGHHGSTGASSPTFMNRMAPAYAIVEVAHGSENLPTKEALDNCYDAGAIQYRTDLDYIVQVMVDDSDNYEIKRWQVGSDSSSPDINWAPPDLVTGLTVDEADDIKVVISWSDGGYDYDVYRSQFPGGDDSAGTATQPGVAYATGIYEKLTAAPIDYTTYTDTSWPIKEIAYYYVIASIASTNTGAYYTKQERRWSNEVSAYVPKYSPTPTPVGYKTPTPTPTPTLTPEGYKTPTTTPTPVPTAPITGTVLITEVHQNEGASPIGTHEWVEIQNLNGSVINLQNWRIGTVDSVDEVAPFVSDPATLLDGECAIIHFFTTGTPASENDSSGRDNAGYGAVFDFYVADSNVFDDTQDQVVLKDSGNAYRDAMVYWDGQANWSSVDPQALVDGGEWDSSSSSAAVNLGGTSSIRMMKRIDADDNNDKSDWLAFSASGGDGATPGMENTGYRPPIMLITEADPRGLNATVGHPWFELQNVSGSSLSINLNGWITDSMDDNEFMLSSSSVTLNDGRMALVHYADGVSENDSTGWSYSTSQGAKLNCFDLYLGDEADGDLYTPQDEIVLYNFIGPDYGVSGPEDAVVYWDGNYPSASGADAATLLGWGQWSPDSSTGNMVSYGTSANGFQRQTSVDTNAKGDWTVLSANSLNPGLQNMGYYQPTKTPVGYKTATPTPTPTATPTPTPGAYDLLAELNIGEPILSIWKLEPYLFILTKITYKLYIYNNPAWSTNTELPIPAGGDTGGVYADSYYIYAASGDWLYRWNNDGTFGESGSSNQGKAISSIYGDGSDYLFAAYTDGDVERFDRADFTSSTVLSNQGTNRYDVFVDSYYIYAADGDKQIYVWNESDLSFVAAFSPQSASNWATESAAMTAVHADSYYLFAGNANDNVYEFTPGTYWNGTTDYKTRKDFATETITALFADPLSRYYYASSEDSNVYVYDTAWWDVVATLTEGADAMNDVWANTEYIIGGCENTNVYIWMAENTPTPTPMPTAPTPTPTTAPNLEIVINEVAWMGTSHSTFDEWIELFNPSTDTDINIENWSIYGADADECLNFASSDGFTTFTIAAGGYATFANDSWVFQTGAGETIWDSTIGLNNTGGDRLILYDQPNCAGNVVDIVDDDNGSWLAGESLPLRKTMERRDPGRHGIDPANWVTWSGVAFAKDSSNWDILGSPGAINAGYSIATPTPSVTPTPSPTAEINTPSPTPTPVSYKTPVPTPTSNVYGWVVFNEIAWMGTTASYGDEWIELYVNNGTDIAMQYWTIEASDGSPSFTIGTLFLNAGDYALFERQSDNTVSDIAADFVYPYPNWLHNDGEDLWLKDDGGDVIDHINMADYWWAGENTTYHTMERVRPDWPSDERYNWATWNGTTHNGKDATGEDLFATADSRNSVWSSSAPTPVVSPTPAVYLDICFNEIAWMGTEAAAAHEWIECKNNSGAAINMKGFRIYTRSGNVDFTVLSDVNITAGGYYIFEQGTDYVVRDVTGYVYSDTGYLSNAGERLILESNGVLWDDIDYTAGWPAGIADPVVYTMEKINSTADGNVAANWANNDGDPIVGRDADDDPINGTAKAGNSVPRRALRAPATGILQPELYQKDRYYPAPTPGGDVPTPPPAPEEADLVRVESADYDGDGIADIAIFRPGSGLWVISDLSRFYFGESDDLPVSGDYDGDGSADVAIYRSGLWAIKDLSRVYFGAEGDIPIPGDYTGDGAAEIAIFRAGNGLWAVKGLTKLYFGGSSDVAVPGDYDGDGAADIGIFRGSTGLWKIKDLTLFYLGTEGDIAVPGDYDGSGLWTAGIFRPASGLWAIRGFTRLYFGEEGDRLLPGDYDGDLADDIAIFRPSAGLWAVRDLTRLYLGK